jgi:tRNA dimethylallyltransferase
MQPIKLISIVGPTASGKSDLAVRLARKFQGEVVSADSRQVYRGLNIGTGKITKKERRHVPHHLLDVASPSRTFTAAQYQKLADRSIRDISKRGRIPIICGGTGFYIDSLLYGFQLPPVKPDVALRAKLENMPNEDLLKELASLDPARAGTIDPKNRRRLIRALEIVMLTNKPVPELKKEPRYHALKIGIAVSKEDLQKRIHARLVTRLKQGMIAETKRLHRKGLSFKRLHDLGLEYREISRFLRGEIGQEEMEREIEKESYHYAKRQMTWFKRDKGIHWISSALEAEQLVRIFLKKV